MPYKSPMAFVYGMLLMFLAACSFGTAAIFIKLAYRAGLQPAGLLPLQNLVSLACLWPLLLGFAGFPRLNRQQARRVFWQGLLGNFGISVCYFWSAQRIDVSLLTIILFTYPGLVLGYEIRVRKRRASALEYLALSLSAAGAVMAVDPFRWTAGGIDGVGLLLAVGAAAAYAFLILCGKTLAGDLSPLAISTLTSTVSTIALMAVLHPKHWFSLAVLQQGWWYIAVVAVLSTVVPMNLMYLGMRRIGAFHASIISVAELPCILVLAYFILGERMTASQLLGGGMILLSFFLIRPDEIR